MTMTARRSSDPLAHGVQTAQLWLRTVAIHLGTEDEQFAYRVLRAWLHRVRDRLGIDVAAHFSAQLPLVLRGLFFEGWVPHQVPVRYDPGRFTAALAQEALIPEPRARTAAAQVTAAFEELTSTDQIDHLVAQLPAGLRDVLRPVPPPRGSTEGEPPDRPAGEAAGGGSAEARLAAVERELRVLADALRALVDGLEERPSDEPRPPAVAQVARRMHQILLSRDTGS
ncbi:DUF2267 domain-containing protein [Geodermatophilus ruber]|uniref:Uncharacterized conserved protein, DUF2267 family n=1 Tax=Geodermatophilus ruber TaxID=504800 RepID=A0A1I4DXC4_9ACTN|nr:DUF2267 domain-containing protein [Geodermatophilus ruber]SFK96561.1 Uncharacterized conserved protein, DUF2267 family [Geodermatophilus ruber]